MHGLPLVSGSLKTQPEHFRVRERLPFEPEGTGEHCWVWIRKTRQNTDQLARQLARFAKVSYRDVGYSGLKDFQAVTEQWFSLWLPGREAPDWSGFSMPGVEILREVRHSRKIKRGTHSHNEFSILLEDLEYLDGADPASLGLRLNQVKEAGVPNYFGPQRFGQRANNLEQASQLLAGHQKVKNRALRSLLISSARSFLFNMVVSQRLRDGSFLSLYPGEPVNLDGTGSVFTSDGDKSEAKRLAKQDIHPTAPLWGRVSEETTENYPELRQFESQVVAQYQTLSQGLQGLGASYQRRPVRMRVADFKWQLEPSRMTLNFSLRKGQFATSVLREFLAPSAEAA